MLLESAPEDEKPEVGCFKKYSTKIISIVFVTIALLLALLVGMSVETAKKNSLISESEANTTGDPNSVPKLWTLQEMPLIEFWSLEKTIDYFPE